MDYGWKLLPEDVAVLRDLGKRKADYAANPVNLERRRSWLSLHAGRCERPMVLAEWGGIQDKRRPFEPVLQCREEWAQGIERGLREALWVFDQLRDDHVIEPYMDVRWFVTASDFGVKSVVHRIENSETMTSRTWDPPLTNLQQDFAKLRHTTYTVDRAKTLAWKALMEDVFANVLPVRLRGGYWWTRGMTILAIDLIGIEQLMLYMYDDPEGLHRLMRFLCDDHLAYAEWLEKEGLLTLNNENDYTGSGTVGYTAELPQPDWQPGMPVRLRDQWVLLESQETVGVGPELFEEFIFPYQQEIARRFGLVYYGCCEPVHTRWQVLKKMQNLRAVSIAPLCNQQIMAECLGGQYVFSRKPNPTLISTPVFNEALIRDDLRTTLKLTHRHGCLPELIMKDVHTLSNEPHRLARWVQLAREESAAVYGTAAGGA